MSWIAYASETRQWMCRESSERYAPGQADLLRQGSIVIDTNCAPFAVPFTIVNFERRRPLPRSLSISAIPGGGLAMVIQSGDGLFHTSFDITQIAPGDTLRLTLSWDLDIKQGWFAIEIPNLDWIEHRTTPPPLLYRNDILEMLGRNGPNWHESTIASAAPDIPAPQIAVSDSIEPIGPQPTLARHTPVLTPSGYRSIETLSSGDLVVSPNKLAVPILARVTRTLPGLDCYQPIRIRAPFLELGQDILVAPQQRLVMNGSQVEYQFGHEHVLMAAADLPKRLSTSSDQGATHIEYHQLLLPHNESIIVAGTHLESLFIGRIRRKRDQLRHSILSNIPHNSLPEHTRAGLKVLRSYEAQSLMGTPSA